MRTCRVSYFDDDDTEAIRYVFEVDNRVSGQEIYLIGLGILFANSFIPEGDEIVEFDLDGLWIPIVTGNIQPTVNIIECIEEEYDDDNGEDEEDV